MVVVSSRRFRLKLRGSHARIPGAMDATLLYRDYHERSCAASTSAVRPTSLGCQGCVWTEPGSSVRLLAAAIFKAMCLSIHPDMP